MTKEILFKGLKMPDMRALKLLGRLRNRKDDTIMLAIVDELARDGIEVVDQTQYLKPLMPCYRGSGAGNPACLGIWRICYGCQITFRRAKGRNYQR